MMNSAKSKSWKLIYEKYCKEHDFKDAPFAITSKMIKQVVSRLKASTTAKEVRTLAKLDTRESRPAIFQKNNLFILPTKNGEYVIVQGEGYIDIPEITSKAIEYKPTMDFELQTSLVGNSEMQHVDYAYAVSILRTFLEDKTLVLTIRGRKYTPSGGFEFNVGKHKLRAASVQTEVDGGYEGKDQVVLVEAKSANIKNVIIRQMYYPFRQWQSHTTKPVRNVFFEKEGEEYKLWEFEFKDASDYNSIRLVKSARYVIKH